MDQHEWEPVTKGRLTGFAIGFGLFLLVLFRSEPGFVFIVDPANLLFTRPVILLSDCSALASSHMAGQSGN
jgi:hypothetical protein